MSARRVRLGAVVLVAAVAAVLPATAGSAQAPKAAGDGLSPEVVAQIEALQADKAERSPAEQKVDSNLLYAAREAAGDDAVDGAPQMKSTIDPKGGRVLVDLDATVDDGLLAAIRAAGGKVVSSLAAYDSVRATLPIAAVVGIAGRSGVRSIRPADEATTNRVQGGGSGGGDAAASSVGAGNNEADVTLAANAARTTYGVDGSGVKACVLSDGVNSLSASIASGDLPAVDVLAGQGGSGDEGTAMLELIHDIAPGADLGFATAFSGIPQFAQNILNLRSAGCDVIVDDVTYYAEPTFQDGVIAQAITTVRNSGALYFSSAGNSGNVVDGTAGTWQGDFQDNGAAGAPLPAGSQVHGWGNSTSYNTLTTASGPINLQWSDPFGASTNDYDLFVLNSAGTAIVSSSTSVQAGAQDPAESVAAPASGSRIVVTKKAAAAGRYLVLYTNRGKLSNPTTGAARGHNVSPDAITVAAVPAATAFGSAGSPAGPYPGTHSSSSTSELFSSDGPTRQFFSPAGSALTPGNFSSTGGVVRNGVDITSADGAATTVPGFTRFYGTSAAAPDAAAVAALALEAKPTLTPAQFEAGMASTALDIEGAGVDATTGPGIMMAPALLSGFGSTPKAKLAAGSRTVAPVSGDGDGYIESGETADLTQVLDNRGSLTATGISATLVSNSANAVVTRANVNYPNIAAGASGSQTGLPFRIAVKSNCPCGTFLSFTLTVQYAGGVKPSFTIPIVVPVGQPGATSTVAYAGAPVAIPDNLVTGASATVSVSDTTPISSASFTIGGSACNTTAGSTTVGIDHSYVSDLILTLTSPHGTTVTLMSGQGVGGNNICQTVFSDSAPTSIATVVEANAPFTGTYKPVGTLSSFTGEDPQGTWTFKAVDRAATDTGSIRAFSLSINGFSCDVPNAAPVAVNDSYTTPQGVTLTKTAPGVLANDSDPSSDPITASLVSGPAHGSTTLNANGSFTYVPTAGYHGPDSFTYRASDGTSNSNTATASITVNGTPAATGDSYATPKNTAKVVAAPGVLGNDADPEGDPLTAVLAAGPTHGTVVLNANGSFTYTPTTGYVGADSFTYKASDGSTQSAAQTVTLGVKAPPVAVDDGYATTPNTTLNITAPGVLGNDSDPEGLTPTASLVSGPSHGNLTLNANGSFAYTPAAAYTGTDTFTYKAVDTYSSSNTATVTITVSAVNQPPTASGDSYATPRNTALVQAAPGMLGNDSDPEGGPITAVLNTGPTHGNLALNANGSFTYTPTNGFSGTDSFTYKSNDGSLSSAAATVTIKVNAVPVANPDSYNAVVDTALNVAAPGVLGNDTDAEGDALNVQQGTGPSHGTLTLQTSGAFTYTPNGGYTGPDSFTYKAKDATWTSAAATVSITVGAANAAPVATADSYQVARGHALTIAAPGVLGNDTDADGDALTASIVTTAQNGTVSLQSNGSFVYTPAGNYTGPDSFAYRAFDGTSLSNTVQVNLLVLTPTEAFVRAVYGDFLTRPYDAAGGAFWVGRLDRGVETRTSFVLKMSRSHEYAVKIVSRAFVDVLGRTVDPSGREYWANKVQHGMPIATLVLNLIASNEYLTHTGGTVAGFVNSTYQAILGRQPTSSERTARVNEINAGKKRLDVATSLYNSVESRQRRVRVQYLDLLNRQPTTAELNSWVSQLATKSDADLAVALGASTEYYNNAQLI